MLQRSPGFAGRTQSEGDEHAVIPVLIHCLRTARLEWCLAYLISSAGTSRSANPQLGQARHKPGRRVETRPRRPWAGAGVEVFAGCHIDLNRMPDIYRDTGVYQARRSHGPRTKGPQRKHRSRSSRLLGDRADSPYAREIPGAICVAR